MPFEITMRGGKVYKGWMAASIIMLSLPILAINLLLGRYVVVNRGLKMGWLIPVFQALVWSGIAFLAAREAYLWWRLTVIAYHLHHPR